MAKSPGPSDSDPGARKARPVKPVRPKAVRPKRAGAAPRKPGPAAPVKPKAVSPKAVPPKAVPPKAVSPKAVPPKAVPPKPVSPKAVPPKPVPPKAASVQALPPKPAPAARPARPQKAAPARPAPAPTRKAAGTPSRGQTPSKKAAARPARAQAATPAPGAPEGGKAARRPARAADEPRDDPLIGKTIGRCRIEELVGVGKTALVYRAHYEALDDDVAVKILRSEIAQNPTLVDRFQSEARAIAKVDNENVLKIYDVGQEEGLYYMVVEFLDGEEVYEVIRREGQVDPLDALRIIRQAANGLRAAHSHDLVHRDIKPQNLFLLEDGTVKVVDFGLATGFDDTSERVGTPHYMAPEVCEHGNAEFASDIYGLGIVLYHLLVGQPPYSGKDIQGILRAHMEARPLRVRQHRPGTPREVCDVLEHLTKRDPLLRPTAAALVEELDGIGGKELKQKDTLKKRTRSSRARSAVARRQRGRKSAAPILIAAAVFVAGLLFLLNRGGDEKPDPKGSGGASTAGTSGTTEPVEPIEPVETEEEKKARFERKFLAEREAKSKQAFENAENYARRIWREPKDTAAVLSKYSSVVNSYKDTTGAKAASFRLQQIKKKEIHPHPDRELTTASKLESIRADWKVNAPKVLTAIAAFDYSAASGLVPPPVSDETGSFQRELDFWREHTARLVEFRSALAREVMALPREERLLETPEGEARVVGLNAKEFEVEVDRKKHKFTWAEVGAPAIADLGLSVFSDKDARLLLLQLAFTFAHELKDAFWDAKMTLETTPGASAWSRESKQYKKRFK